LKEGDFKGGMSSSAFPDKLRGGTQKGFMDIENFSLFDLLFSFSFSFTFLTLASTHHSAYMFQTSFLHMRHSLTLLKLRLSPKVARLWCQGDLKRNVTAGSTDL
jgi:hypothetical protein